MADFSNDIKRYIQGEMTPAERHALEKRALSNPFLADALEGMQEMKAEDFSEDIHFLEAAINKKLDEKTNKVPLWIWSVRIAAGLVLLILATYSIWNFTVRDITTSQVSENDNAQATPLTSTTNDSTEMGKASDQLALVEETRASKQPSSRKALATEPSAAKKAEIEENDTKAEDLVLDELTKPTSASKINSTAGALSKEMPSNPISVAEAKNEEEAKNNVAEVEMSNQASRKVDAKKIASPSTPPISNSIRGRVTSAEDGSPLPGVNVVIKGTTVGTVTDVSGNYMIENADKATTLQYSFIGLQSKDVSVDNKNTLDVALNLDVTQLSEVVVTGYGYSTDSELTPTVDLAHPAIGNKAYKKYLEASLRYPQEALDTKTEGRVTVEFFVEKNGTLTDFTILKGIGSGCDEELIRLIKEGPTWVPTEKDKAPIRDKAKVRLKFELPKK